MIVPSSKKPESGGSSNSSFLREYAAQFTDGSDSYFSAKKMHLMHYSRRRETTHFNKRRKNKEYILAIDPSFSNSPSSDFFAMSVLELDEEKTTFSTLVHGYAVAGGDLKNHIKYLHYLVNYFNFSMIIIDNAGYQFIDSANESELFQSSRTEIKFF